VDGGVDNASSPASRGVDTERCAEVVAFTFSAFSAASAGRAEGWLRAAEKTPRAFAGGSGGGGGDSDADSADLCSSNISGRGGSTEAAAMAGR